MGDTSVFENHGKGIFYVKSKTGAHSHFQLLELRETGPRVLALGRARDQYRREYLQRVNRAPTLAGSLKDAYIRAGSQFTYEYDLSTVQFIMEEHVAPPEEWVLSVDDKVISSFRGKYLFLSNFYTAKVGRYPTAEHAFQAGKCVNVSERLLFAAPDLTAKQAKALGRKVTMRKDWDDIKVEYLRDVIQEKFNDPKMEEKLLATGDAVLMEENDWGDTFYGLCGGRGKNWLGILLMVERAVRAHLRQLEERAC